MARDPNAVLAGTGYMHYAELTSGGTVPEPPPASAPSDYTAAPGGNWEDVGYSDDGWALEWELTFEEVRVAEEPAPIRTLWTEADYRLTGLLAQFDLEALSLALNAYVADTITNVSGPPVERTFTPPSIGDDKAHSFLFQFLNENGFGSYIYFPAGKTSGAADVAFRKAPEKSLLGLEIQANLLSGQDIFTVREYVSAS